MREDGRLREAAVAHGAVVPVQEPVPRPKVDSLADGEAMGEASVVGAREGDNEFARLLHSPADLHTCNLFTRKLQLWASTFGRPKRTDSNMYVSVTVPSRGKEQTTSRCTLICLW